MLVCGEIDQEFIDIKEKDILEFIQEIEKKYDKKAKDMREEKEILKHVIKERALVALYLALKMYVLEKRTVPFSFKLLYTDFH